MAHRLQLIVGSLILVLFGLISTPPTTRADKHQFRPGLNKGFDNVSAGQQTDSGHKNLMRKVIPQPKQAFTARTRGHSRWSQISTLIRTFSDF